MLYLTCTTRTSVDLAHYGVSRAKDLVSVNCGTIFSLRPLFKPPFEWKSIFFYSVVVYL